MLHDCRVSDTLHSTNLREPFAPDIVDHSPCQMSPESRPKRYIFAHLRETLAAVEPFSASRPFPGSVVRVVSATHLQQFGSEMGRPRQSETARVRSDRRHTAWRERRG
jgi:hypothetical protein